MLRAHFRCFPISTPQSADLLRILLIRTGSISRLRTEAARTFERVQSPSLQLSRNTRFVSTTSMSADTIEAAKKAASERAVRDHFDVKNHKRIGIGSGSTIAYVVDAIKEVCSKEASPPQILYVPTGAGSRGLVTKAGLVAIDYETLEPDQDLDVAFDGADEVDDEFNLVKGGGACLFQEKLVAARARKFIVVAGM